MIRNVLQMKADISSGSTVILSGFALFLHNTNTWFAEFMPLISGLGILFGAFMTWWYYTRMARERKRENDIRAKALKRRVSD